MVNIGSEVGRTLEAKRQGKTDRAEQALVRALDLFAATVEQLANMRSPRLKEVRRARELFLGAYAGMASDPMPYFLAFGLAARRTR